MSRSKCWGQWTDPLTKETDSVFCSSVAAILSRRGLYSEYLYGLVLEGRLREAIEFSVPMDAELEDFRGAVQIQALFRKDKSVEGLGYNPRLAAVEACIKAELQCADVNRYFGQLSPFGGVTQLIGRARRKIATVLGPVPSLGRLKPRFGPGASTHIKRAEACFENKLARQIVCSEDFLPVVSTFLAETPAWVRHQSSEFVSVKAYAETETEISWLGNPDVVVDVGRLIFVDKNAKTDRPICIEPCFNGFWQLAVGDYIKDRLCILANQDLRNQERNQLLAREGSVTGKLATLDLSSASDTLAFSVVFDLLPEDWVNLLSSLRTGTMEYAGHQYELEKFSSMGNGFTFELESLIFWALAWAATDLRGGDLSKVSVYGDDIIVPVESVDLLNAALVWCGFNVNSEKSFWTGPFRESCGADWLLGEDVRPIFKKDRLSLQWLFVFHNWAMRHGERDLADVAKALIPSAFQLYGPDGYGDGHLLGSWEMIKPRAVRRGGWGGGYFHTFRELPRSVVPDGEASHLYGLFDLYARGATSWWKPLEPRRPGTVPGTGGVERASIYTFAESIFIR